MSRFTGDRDRERAEGSVTLLAAVTGSKAGTHYHRKIDQVGY